MVKKISILQGKEGRSNIVLLIIVLIILAGVVTAFLYFPPVPTFAAGATKGDITFTDSAGNPLTGAIRLSGEGGISSGLKPNINFVRWDKVPDARIYYNAFDTKGIAVSLRISGDSSKGRVMLEDHAVTIPEGVNITAPGTVVKYVEVSAAGVSFADAEISIRYTDAEVAGLNESSLGIYQYDSAAQAWNLLETRVDAANNIASATVNYLSIFALSTPLPQEIMVHDTGNKPVISDIKVYDKAKTLKKGAKDNKLSAADLLEGGELEVDALATKNVAVKLKVTKAGRGEIILDDFGKKNPVSVLLPGRVVKFVEIGVNNISFSSANVTIRYTDKELNGGNEIDLTIYHWNGASWEAMPTIIDTMNKTLSTTAASLSYWGVATSYRYYLENNRTNQSVGADGTTNWTGNGLNTSVKPYKNLMKNGTMGTAISVNYTTTTTSQEEAFRFYLPFNYSNDTTISANTTFNISWRAMGTNNNINVSLIDYNPANGAKIVIGNRSFTTTGGTTRTNYSFQINHSAYTVAAGRRLLFQINTTTPTVGPVTLWFNNTVSNITVIESVFLSNISGYVKNASSGAPLSGATVTTNTSLTTTTNATGFYNFTGVANGTYLINAILADYADNSITVTISGADNTTANISLTPIPPVSGKILVATNRYVILDDPIIGIAGPGFVNPGNNYNTWNYWSGKNTRINATALYIDKNGTPVQGINITFTLRNPGEGINSTNYSITDSRGLANFSFDLNAANYYGRWNVSARNGSFGMNYTFIYNWWGCASSAGACSDATHFGADPTTEGYTSANSPYLSGRDRTTAGVNAHSLYNCTVCHQSFDGLSGGNIVTANHTNYTKDVHRNISCANAGCHGDYTKHSWRNAGGTKFYDNMVIASCYNTTGGCHTPANRSDISNKSTLNSSNVNTALSLYSINSTAFNATFHTPNSTVPCTICHGPMHNISKPDITQNFTRNKETESSQCITCHSSYQMHNASVNCTVCHSDDVHVIQVFAQNATYITLNKSNPNTYRGNCTNCHQNATFLLNLTNTTNNPKAGYHDNTSYPAPQIPKPMNHSNDPSSGEKWEQTYWTSGTSGNAQLTSCIYCHSNTTHSAVALGRPANWAGNNIVNSSLAGNTTWCSGCHWQGYANGSNVYSNMTGTFTGAGLPVPPETSGHATYGANTSIYEYTNHSLYTNYYPDLNDSSCNRCHGYRYGFTTITQLMHNQTRVGGANCADCHDIGGIALVARVNITTANDTNAIHKSLNINASGTNSTAYYNNSKRCWACHSNGSEPTIPDAHPASYKTPYNCTDCHIQSATQNFNFTPNNTLLNVSEHYWNASEIHTPAISACYACHNKSEMLISANDPDAGSGAVYGGSNAGNNSTSHYGKKRADIRVGINASCAYCHQNASTVFSTAMLDPTYNKSINNHSLRYTSTPDCTTSQCHSTGWIHNSTLVRPNFTLPNSTFCLDCHGRNSTTGLINFTGAITSIKEKHNNTINCTECHLSSSRDIHPMKYLQPNASYNTGNSTAVNCINCHQNLTVYPSLSRTPPKIPSPMYHSDNLSNGTLWNTTGYWTNDTVTSCTYCHNDTKHNVTALGRPAYWKGDNTVNSSITSASNWCAGCHYQGYLSGAKNYSDMTSTFTTANLPVPPEITNGTYAPYNFSRYYNHSLANYTDAACKLCHGINLTSDAKMTAFVHNITWGSCTDCHYSFSAMNVTTRPDRFVNSTMFNASPHVSVACSNCHTKGHKNIGARKACEDCHAYQQAPLTDRDRHNITRAPSSGVVTNTDCTSCHDATLYNNATTNYGYNKTRDCDYCHTYPDKTYS